MANLNHHINQVSKLISKAQNGLPEELFYFISSVTPMTNVDLLIKDNDNRTLLTWRNDKYYGPGWYIPGGIIRFKETFSIRISEVAKNELGIKVIHEENPASIKELFAKEATSKGIERITELGKMSIYDYPWDGMFPMNRFIRWASLNSNNDKSTT